MAPIAGRGCIAANDANADAMAGFWMLDLSVKLVAPRRWRFDGGGGTQIGGRSGGRSYWFVGGIHLPAGGGGGGGGGV